MSVHAHSVAFALLGFLYLFPTARAIRQNTSRQEMLIRKTVSPQL